MMYLKKKKEKKVRLTDAFNKQSNQQDEKHQRNGTS